MALDIGLARERTALAWNRTALALLVNAVLVLVRHDRAFPLAVSATLSVLSVAVALAVLAAAAHRARIIDQSSEQIRPATGFVVLLGVAVVVLCLATAASILLEG